MKFKNGISVVVTLFNKEDFITQTLNSAIEQFTTRNFQIIVVDDGSSDNSFMIAKNLLKKLKKIDSLVFTQKNSGPSIAINNALKHVKYSFLKLLDGDDIISPDSLDYMKHQMELKNLDLLYGYWEWSNNPDKFKFKKNKPPSSIMVNPLKRFIISGWGGSSNLMVRTNVLKEVGGCDEAVFVQDFSIPLRIAGNHLKFKNAKQFIIGESKKTICVGPAQIENRIMSNSSQTLYDLSLATLNYIDTAKELHDYLRRNALKKIIARCWSWRRRANKYSFFSWFFIIYLMSKINYKLKASLVRYYVYRTWIDDITIRKISCKDIADKKVLIYVGLDLLGDALIKLPMLKSIKEVFPNAKITWFAGKGKSAYKNSLKQLSEKLIYKTLDDYNYGSSILDFLKKPPLDEYDIVIDTQKRVLTTLLLKRIKTKIFISPCANYIFSDLVPRKKKIKNLSKHLVSLVEIFSPRKIKFLNILDNKNSNRVGICPGASVIWKKWMIENFIEVAEYLIRKKLKPVFILGPKEKDLERNLNRAFGQRIILFKSIDPMQTIKMAKTLKAGISNDTGCGHLMASAGIPVVSIFGPTNSEKFSPIGNPMNTSISSQESLKSKDINSIPTNLVIRLIKDIVN